MSAEECQAADWRQLGYSDAAQSGGDNFTNRAASCSKKGFTADAGAYRTGFDLGMRAFCTPERGFSTARYGNSFNGQCPADLADGFNQGYADGQRAHDALGAVEDARNRIAEAENRRDRIDHDIRDRQHDLSAATTDEERARIQRNIDDLRRDRRDANEDLRIANDQLPRAMRLLDDVRAEIGGRYGSW
jgi:hypothetical protein